MQTQQTHFDWLIQNFKKFKKNFLLTQPSEFLSRNIFPSFSGKKANGMAILGPNSLVQPFAAELEQPQLSQPALPVVWSASSGHIIADLCVRCCKIFEFVDYGRESLSLESPPTRMILSLQWSSTHSPLFSWRLSFIVLISRALMLRQGLWHCGFLNAARVVFWDPGYQQCPLAKSLRPVESAIGKQQLLALYQLCPHGHCLVCV